MLNLRRGPGAYALLSRADGQLTRAGQRYYSHLGLRPPSKDFDYNLPLIREGPNDYILLRNGRKKVRFLQGGEQRLTKLGKGFFRDGGWWRGRLFFLAKTCLFLGLRPSGHGAELAL